MRYTIETKEEAHDGPERDRLGNGTGALVTALLAVGSICFTGPIQKLWMGTGLKKNWGSLKKCCSSYKYRQAST